MRRAAALLTCTVLIGGLAACTSGTGTSGSTPTGGTPTSSTPISSTVTARSGSGTTGSGATGSPTTASAAPAAADSSLVSMLAMVPASMVAPDADGTATSAGAGAKAANTAVTINLYWKAAAAGGLTVPHGPAQSDPQTQYALDLTNNLKEHIGMAGSDLLTQAAGRTSSVATPLAPSQIAADVQAGTPPRIAIAARGTFDTSALNTAFHDNPTWKGDLTTPSYHGHRFYRWLDDLKIDVTKANTGLLTDVGNSRRIALPDSSTFLYGRDDATMHALLDLEDDPSGSLASDARYRQVATALDEHGVYSAMILGLQPLDSLVASARLSPEQAKQVLTELRTHALKPYLLAGIGETLVHGSPRTVIVLANADNGAARANAEALRGLITDGKSMQANEPWSDLFGIDSITTDGALTIGVLTLTEPAHVTSWHQAVYNRDTLLAAG